MARARVSPPPPDQPLLPFAEPAPPPSVAKSSRSRLVTGAPGSGKTHVALSALDDAVAAHGPDRALLLLPTYGDVEHARRVALSRRGVGGLLDAPFATFTSLPERLLPGARVGALPSRAERDLLAGEALREAGVPAFEAVRGRKGFRARFLRLVKELKQTGEDPGRLRARAREAQGALESGARERWSGFVAAWERYDALLARAGVSDHEDVLRTVLDRLRTDPPDEVARLAFLGVDGFDDLTGLEEALVLAARRAVVAAGGSVLVTLTLDDARPDLFEPARGLRDRLVGDGFSESPLAGYARADGALAHLATSLFGPGARRVDAGGSVVPIVGRDPDDEVDRIGREVRRLVDPERSDLAPRRPGEGPLAFRDVGIVFRRLDADGPRFQRALEALGVPTRLAGAGPSLASEPVVRALRGPLSVVAGAGMDGADVDAARVLDWMRWRALASGDPLPVDVVDAVDMTWRKLGFPADWHGILASAQHPRWRDVLGEVERARVACAAARGPDAVYGALVDAVDALAPLPVPAGFDAAGRPLDPEGDERCRRATTAKRRLLDVARGLRAAARRTGLFPDLDVRTAVAQWADAVEETTCPLPDRRLEAVTLLDAEEARHYELPVVFVAGLVEKEFPLQPRQDVFLHDDDRTTLFSGGPARLRTARADEERERRLLLQAVTRARRRLYLCRHATDADGRDKAPSLLWAEVDEVLHRLDADGRERPFSADAPALRGEPTPLDALSEGDLLRHVAARLGEPALPGREAERRVAVALLRTGAERPGRVLARAARFRRPAEDPLDAGALDAFTRAAAAISPTGATTALECLHRFFLSKVVRLREDDAPVAGRLFDRRDLGSLVHAALRLAVLHPAEAPPEVAAAALSAGGAAAPPVGSAARDAVASDLARVVELFRVREAKAAESGFVPSERGLEVAFGGEGEPEVVLGHGAGRFRLHGRIDRVDLLHEEGAEGAGGTKAALVLDYKLGKSTAGELIKATLAGENLQLPLYARAIEVAWGVPVVALEGYAAYARRRDAVFDAAYADDVEPRREGRSATGKTSEEFRRLLDEAERKASDLVATIRKGGDGGHVKQTKDAERCDLCGYRAICRPDALRSTRRGS